MFGREPTVILSGIAEVARQIIPLLMVFGVIHWTGDQVAQFTLFVGVLIAAITTALQRSQVTSTTQTDALIKTAVKLPTGTTVAEVKAEQAEKDAK